MSAFAQSAACAAGTCAQHLAARASSGINNATSYSTPTFVTAIVFNSAVFGGEILAFTLLRPYFPAIYQPRTYVPPEGKRAPALTQYFLFWPWAIFKADYRAIKDVNGLDAYFFVRYLRTMVRVLVPIWFISWVILLPVDSVGTTSGQSDSLTQFEFGNIGKDQQSRLWAHLVLAWVFTIWIWWNIRHEMSHFVKIRQRWLMSCETSSSAQANTVLVTGVPQRYLSEAALRRLFAHLPGGVAKVWVNRDLKEMPELYERRVNACKMLESAETSLLHTAIKLRNKRLQKEAKAAKKNGKKVDQDSNSEGRHLTDMSLIDTERGDVSLADQLVPREKRPTHRLPLKSFLPSLPLVGKQVDSIEWAREEIATTSAELKKARRTLAREVSRSSSTDHIPTRDSDDVHDPNANMLGTTLDTIGNTLATTLANVPLANTLVQTKSSEQTYPPLNSAFILFNQQIAAHLAAQSLTHHAPYRMAQKHIGVAPADIIWSNLNMNPYEAKIRAAISWAATLGLIVLWSFPVAFIGAVSNIHSLCSTYHWLAWVCDLPKEIVGIISGILPPVLLAVLMMLLPIVLRIMARAEGMTTRSSVELSLMSRYFLFLVIHSFLIVTLSSGIIAALPSLLEDPGDIPSLLANNLPKASTFFLTYIILQGLSGTASGFLSIVPLAIYYVKLYLTGSTPRSIYHIKFELRSVQWGTTFPTVTLLTVITLSYSVISPIINGLALASFFLFYQMWKYHFMWQLGQPRATETGGLFFPKAIQHIFIGLYLQQVCLAALFFLAQDIQGQPSAVPEGALMVVLIGFTAFFHLIISNSYGPLIEYLPLTLAAEELAQSPDPNRAEAARELRETDSAVDVASPQQEKMQQQGQEMRARPTSENGKAREKTAEDVDADADAGSVTESGFLSPDRRSRVEQRSAGTGTAKRRSILSKERRSMYGTERLSVYGSERRSMVGTTMESVQGVDEESGPKDFYHPASVEPQQTIWIPVDELGLAEAEERANRERGIKVSTVDAHMDQNGHVDITGAPPDDGVH
ncbi:DUF221-domain-containing protein [Wolfiporia cocos MD-104 SS10]|uniref:DUF221-domain-containing protein n=1 Tax=Wolfiporia cocos (strain MD-104) TaxID=742152 RepID=A0A2H3IZ59_WOLCO|nr:DUF221-domain-containing protein [Wolfiporia cocos MD-104 SS10]